jgi:GT2 family glycosyltransferase/uncharacterized LabA/DUF88 family protein
MGTVLIERKRGMTFVSSFGIVPAARGSGNAPRTLTLADLSIVVPVRNNSDGVRRLLIACLDVFTPQQGPREMLLVDNLSHPPLELPGHVRWGVPIRVLRCSRPGPAAARNLGVGQASGNWVLFLDSDCLPTSSLLSGYQQAMNGAIAYVGIVRAADHDPLSQYYESQGILTPHPVWDRGRERPAYLITANALVWRPTFIQSGGFDERFPFAGGEDIDLGIRLWEVGPLSYAPEALALHRFEPDLRAFVRRFVRYGRGNRLLSSKYQVDLHPQAFAAHQPSLVNQALARLQYLAMSWGYATTNLSGLAFDASACQRWTGERALFHASQASADTPASTMAVFVDGDSISADYSEAIVDAVSSWGTVTTCRIYCSQPSSTWDQVCQQTPFTLIAPPTSGNVDLTIAMDAVEYLRTRTTRYFCLVTNDGDFVPVAQWLRLQEALVLGAGTQQASEAFKQACTHFLALPSPVKRSALARLDETWNGKTR